jgi:ABC-type glycerol-3-phosphate transport system substrate-binding protein
MRKRRVLTAALTAGTVALGAGGAMLVTLSASSATASPAETVTQTTTAAQTTTGAPLGAAKIKQIALEFAASMGDPNPTAIEYVQGSRQQVVFAFSKDEVLDNTEVDAIVMHGRFMSKNAPVPAEGSPPSGSVLIMVVNATTGELTDIGIQQQSPNLNAFGPVHMGE